MVLHFLYCEHLNNQLSFSTGHPWLVGSHELKIPSDMIIYKLVKVYIMSTSLRKSALAVSWILQKLWHILLTRRIRLLSFMDENCMINGFFFMVPGTCQDINCTAVSLFAGAIYIVGSKQKWIYFDAELQNSEFCFHDSIYHFPFHLWFSVILDFFIQISGNPKELNRCDEGFTSLRFYSHGKKTMWIIWTRLHH